MSIRLSSVLFSSDTNKIDDEPIPMEFTTNISLFESYYHPYAHSYLCWGKNEALRRHRARLLNAAININRIYSPTSTRLLIRDPCFARGVNETVTINSLFRSACTSHEKQQFNLHVNVSSFTFVGTGNASQCQQRLINLFDAKRDDRTVNCSYRQEYCTFDHTFQPKLPPKINFIGLSGYYYVFHNLAHGNTFSLITNVRKAKRMSITLFLHFVVVFFLFFFSNRNEKTDQFNN
jgi:hypothetical protein